MTRENLLGDYLRARRELVRPAEVGLPAGSARRVPGLRREEVALLAGISADYYLRLEQGRDRNPSAQVLESVARVLRLDEAATRYLLGLVGPVRRRRVRRETVPPGTVRLLAILGLPAFVEGRYFDVLAANDLARAVSPNLTVGRNRLRDLFLDPAERALHPEWDAMVPQLVARLREAVGTDTDDPRAVQLVGELSLASDLFRRLWARHDIRECAPAFIARLQHPQVGELVVNLEKLAVAGTDRQMLVIQHADEGSPSAEKLALLASLTATARVSDGAGPAHASVAGRPTTAPALSPEF